MEQSFKLFTARDKQIYKEQLKRKISSGVFLLLTVTVCLPNPIQILKRALHLIHRCSRLGNPGDEVAQMLAKIPGGGKGVKVFRTKLSRGYPRVHLWYDLICLINNVTTFFWCFTSKMISFQWFIGCNFQIVIDVFRKIADTNWASVIIAAICILVLAVNDEVVKVNSNFFSDIFLWLSK